MDRQEKEDAAVRSRMQKLGKMIDKELPYGWGFVVLAFPFGAGGRMNYLSNSDRKDVVRAMYEFIEASKGEWGQHVEDDAHEDEPLGRARQQIAQLEREKKHLLDALKACGAKDFDQRE